MIVKRIARLNGHFVNWLRFVQIMKDMRIVMVDDDNHASWLTRRMRLRHADTVFHEPAKPRDLLDRQFVPAWFLERGSMRSHDKGKFVISRGFHFAEMTHKTHHTCPAQVAREFAAQKTFMYTLEIVPQVRCHFMIMTAVRSCDCVA